MRLDEESQESRVNVVEAWGRTRGPETRRWGTVSSRSLLLASLSRITT